LQGLWTLECKQVDDESSFFWKSCKKKKKEFLSQEEAKGKKGTSFLRFVKVAQPASPAISISNLGIFF
jgi:hypothetical protein